MARALAEAIAHHHAGRLMEAERLYRVVIGLVPRHGEASRRLGSLLVEDGKPAQAVPLLQDALQAEPNNLEALYCFADALRELGMCEAALDYYAKVLKARPNVAGVHVTIGVCWHALGKPEVARACYMKALEIQPNFPEAESNLGGLLHVEGKIAEALEIYNRVLVHAPDNQNALFAKSLVLLALGEYREGWRLFDNGLGRHDMRGGNPFAAAKPWDGKPAPDKHLLIWSEQGLGDSLQFIRYAELCKQRVGKVSVLCPKPLLRLFKALPFIDDVFDVPQEGRSSFDEHIPMMSLPHRFDTVLETVPAAVPYLRVDPEIQAKWAPKFAGITGMKIGLVWAGGSHEGKVNAALMDKQRSVGLERMKPWLDLQGAEFYSLQKDKPAEQIAALGLADRIADFMGEVTDMADTAAIVQNLDLVIAVDTSVAHLAGGLGKPVWILSRYNADWRWLQNRPTNPWYPTARIFGQPTMGDWDSVMTEVGRELANEIARKGAAVTTQFALSPFRAN
ncbi:tetratricopeptide repeat protein [Bradyrhizobium sp.]